MPQSGDECGQVPAGRFADERRAASTARNNFRVVERMRNEAKVILRRKLEWGMCHRRSCRNRRRGGDTFPATVISAGCLVFSRSEAQAERSGNSRQPAPFLRRKWESPEVHPRGFRFFGAASLPLTQLLCLLSFGCCGRAASPLLLKEKNC